MKKLGLEKRQYPGHSERNVKSAVYLLWQPLLSALCILILVYVTALTGINLVVVKTAFIHLSHKSVNSWVMNKLPYSFAPAKDHLTYSSHIAPYIQQDDQQISTELTRTHKTLSLLQLALSLPTLASSLTLSHSLALVLPFCLLTIQG